MKPMAKASIRTSFTHHLELSSEEANWLCALVQNPIGQEINGFPPEEDARDRRIRQGIFDALNNRTCET